MYHEKKEKTRIVNNEGAVGGEYYLLLDCVMEQIKKLHYDNQIHIFTIIDRDFLARISYI